MKKLIILLVFLFLVPIVEAATIYVDNTVTSCSTPSDTDYEPTTDTCGAGSYTVYDTIQGAANVVNAGDTVIVADGTYTDTNTNDRVINLTRTGSSGNIITFKAENKWGAILDGQDNTDYCFLITGGVSYVDIEDFEIKDCIWGGITPPGSTPFGTNYTFYRNKIHDIGGDCTDSTEGKTGIGGSGGDDYVTIDSNVIYNIGRLATGEGGCSNSTDYWQNHDHGVYSYANYLTIINNVFYDNHHGFDITDGYTHTGWTIANNTFASYNPYRDGNIYFSGVHANLVMENNIFYQPRNYAINIVETGGAGYTNAVIRNNLIGNAAQLITSSACSDPDFSCSNNILSQNPQFTDYASRNFHLLSGSPAINVGYDASSVFTTDYDGDTRPQPAGGNFYIGADEYVPATIYVDPDDCTNGITTYNPTTRACTGGSYTYYTSIQNAANVVNAGDTVIVRDGTYTDTNSDDYIVLLTRSGTPSNVITFQSETKWGAVLDGQTNTTDYCFYLATDVQYIDIEDFEVKGCRIWGFTAYNGVDHVTFYRNNVHDIGRECTDVTTGRAGFYAKSATSDLIFDNNLARQWQIFRWEEGCGYSGGYDHGMYINGDKYTVINNIFYKNRASTYISLSGSYSTLSNWVIANNTFGDHYNSVRGNFYFEAPADNIIIEHNIFVTVFRMVSRIRRSSDIPLALMT